MILLNWHNYSPSQRQKLASAVLLASTGTDTNFPDTKPPWVLSLWDAPGENVSSGICVQRRPRSACASAQSDQGLPCPLTESLDITECMTREQRPGWYFAHAQNELNLHMFVGTFSPDATHYGRRVYNSYNDFNKWLNTWEYYRIVSPSWNCHLCIN